MFSETRGELDSGVRSAGGRPRKLIDRWLTHWVVLAVVGMIPAIVGWDHWAAELLIHWHLWISGSLVFALALLLLRRRWGFAAVAALGVIHGAWIAIPYTPLASPMVPTPVDGGGRRVVVASVNLLQDLGDHAAAMDWVEAQEPDVVVVQELTPNNAFSVRDRLLKVLPHQHCAPEPGSFGSGIAARWPFKVKGLGGTGPTQFVVTVEAPGGPFDLIAVHVWPPIRPSWALEQRATLDRVAARAAQGGRPTIVAGDFNLTPWSPTFTKFLEASRLHDARVGRGLFPTWAPAGWPVPGLIPIDHVLVSSHWKATDLAVGPAFGSDHRAYAATLWIE